MGELEKEKKLQKKRILKRAMALIFAGLCVWYTVWCNIRVPHQFTGTFWSGDGEKIEAVFDLTWYRYLGVPSELRGTVTIAGTTYTVIGADDDRSFPEKLWMKLTGKNDSSHMFVNRTNNPMEWMDDYITLYLEERDKQCEEMQLVLFYEMGSHTKSGKLYYGPTETFEEARRIFFQQHGWNCCREDFQVE